MRVSYTQRCSQRELIPTCFALPSKATSPFQGEMTPAIAPLDAWLIM
ncbi:hypothetical protein ACVWW1_007237 [Bradyrhizobium sp. JR3.5]